MARQPINIGPPNQTIQTLLWDNDGTTPLVQISAGEYLIQNPDRTVTIQKRHSSIRLMCDTMWHPAMQDVRLGVCQLCRKPTFRFPFRDKPRHGLVSLRRSHSCASLNCGLLCPRHAVKCPDGKHRCPFHAKVFALKRFFLALFFKEQEE